MEATSQAIQVFGFFAILASAGLLFVRLIHVFVTGRARLLRVGLELLAFLAILYFFAEPAAHYIGMEELGREATKAVAFLWWVCLALVINTVLRRYVWDGVLSHHGARRVPKLITDGVAIALYAAAIMIVMHFVYDEPIGAILATSGAAALIVGLSAQSTIKEVFAGVALNATQALRLGDFVEIDGVYGQVFEINWRSISIKNPHTNSLYIFPNSGVAERTILNFSEPTGRFKYYVTFVAELSAPPELVIRAVADELATSRYVRRDPKPDFNILGFTDRGVEIRVRYFFDGDDPWWDAQNEVIMAIWSAMRKHGLKIGVNRRWLGSGDEWSELAENVAARGATDRIEQALAESPSFAGSEKSLVANLAKSAEVISLNPPACFYHPGDPPVGLYLVLEGRVGLYQCEDDGAELLIETCEPGQVFGIGSQLDAEPRHYLAQAQQFTVAALLDAKSVSALVTDRPEIEKALRRHLEERDKIRKNNRAREKEAWWRSVHDDNKARMSENIRRGVDNLLARPLFHHLFDALVSRTKHENLLNGMMAGAALVCSARGKVDDAETKYLRKALADADLLRHVDIGQGLELFEKFAHSLETKTDEGSVRRAIENCRGVSGASDIVLAVCHGVSGVHTVPAESEIEALGEIAKWLGEPAEHSAGTGPTIAT